VHEDRACKGGHPGQAVEQGVQLWATQWALHFVSRHQSRYLRQRSRRPTEWVSPRNPRGASALSLPRRIFSSFGKGGKNSGGGG